MAARRTSSTTSPGPGSTGSGTSSMRTSLGPWKTAALTASALDLNLDVPACVARGFERARSVGEREGGSQERRRVDPAESHEANRPRPQTGRADDPAYLQRLRLDQPDLDRCAPTDVDADEDDACLVRRERETARHGRRRPGGLDDDVEPAAFGLARIDCLAGPDLEGKRTAVRLRLDQRHRPAHGGRCERAQQSD